MQSYLCVNPNWKFAFSEKYTLVKRGTFQMKIIVMKPILRYAILLITCLLFFACSGEKKATELYELAAFEELQFNTPHAKQLYQEIIKEYPDTETARKARQALERLP